MLSRSAFRPRHQNSGKADASRRCSAHLTWVRGRDCALADKGDCEGRIEAAHADAAGGKGMGIKVADAYVLPLCSRHHSLSHSLGRKTFEARFGINMVEASKAYAKASPHWARLMEMLS